MAMTPQAVLAMCRERDIKAVDMRFMDFPGIWQHFTIPVGKLEEEVFEEGLGFDGSSIRGWQAINESDMLLLAAGRHGVRRSVHRDPHALHDLQRAGSDHARRLHARSAQRRPQGGQLPEEHRRRRHLLHRSRSRVLHLRRRPLRPDAEQPATSILDSEEGQWNRGKDYSRRGHGTEPRLQAASQGRLLPRAAGRRADGHPQRDDAHDDRVRPRRRSPASRSGHRRPDRKSTCGSTSS